MKLNEHIRIRFVISLDYRATPDLRTGKEVSLRCNVHEIPKLQVWFVNRRHGWPQWLEFDFVFQNLPSELTKGYLLEHTAGWRRVCRRERADAHQDVKTGANKLEI